MTRPLTEAAQAHIGAHLSPAGVAVDATAGNGHDSLFLARHVGDVGHVFAFDIQEAAIKATARRLREADVAHRVTLIQDSHAQLRHHLPAAIDRIDAAMFNLGYLPGANHAVTTTAESSVAAIQTCLALLKAGGAMTVMAYRGHSGGEAEFAAVATSLDATASGPWQIERRDAPNLGPVLWCISRPARGQAADDAD